MELIFVFLALVVACMTLFIQRQHNRKELLPVLTTYFEIHCTQETTKLALWLINDGHGVAILKETSLHLYEGETIKISKENGFSEVIKKHCPVARNIETSLPFTLASNSKELLYRFEIPNNTDSVFNGASATVKAESIYEDIIVATADGFEVTSNRRDALVESWLNGIVDFALKVIPKRN